MLILKRILYVLCILLLAAHWLRDGNLLLVGVTLLTLPLGFMNAPWARKLVLVVLVIGCIVWMITAVQIGMARSEAGRPWLRAAMIISAVVVLNAVAAILNLRQRAVSTAAMGSDARDAVPHAGT